MITVEVEGIKEALRSLDPSLVRTAAMLSINEAENQARAEASRAIREKFNLPVARINREVTKIKAATRSDLTAIIRAQGRPIGLTNFGAKWVRNVGGLKVSSTAKQSTIGKTRARKTGVFVKIGKGETTRLPNAFMARGRRGKVDGAGALQVFQRTDQGRWNSPLMNRATVTVATMMGNRRVMDRVVAKASEVIGRRFAHHLDRLMK